MVGQIPIYHFFPSSSYLWNVPTRVPGSQPLGDRMPIANLVASCPDRPWGRVALVIMEDPPTPLQSPSITSASTPSMTQSLNDTALLHASRWFDLATNTPTFWRHNGTGHPVPGRPPSTRGHPCGSNHTPHPAKAAFEKHHDSLGFRAGGGTVRTRQLFNIISLSLWVGVSH